MKPIAVTTVAAARALPEVKYSGFDVRLRVLQENDPQFGKKGTTVLERVPWAYCPRPTDGHQIMFFIDADGRSMEVVYTPIGPAKTPSRLFTW